MRILFYGDSNTWGYDAKTGMRYEGRFTALIQKAFPQDTIIEEGLCGRTTCYNDPYTIEDRNGAHTIVTVLKTQVPLDLVVIMLGTNDAKRIYGTNSLCSIEKAMEHLLHLAMDPANFKHSDHIPKFLVICPPKMHPEYKKVLRTYTNFGEEGYRMIETMATPLKALCDKMHVDFFDPENVYASSFDALHLDEQGHHKMAEKLIKKLEEYR